MPKTVKPYWEEIKERGAGIRQVGVSAKGEREHYWPAYKEKDTSTQDFGDKLKEDFSSITGGEPRLEQELDARAKAQAQAGVTARSTYYMNRSSSGETGTVMFSTETHQFPIFRTGLEYRYKLPLEAISIVEYSKIVCCPIFIMIGIFLVSQIFYSTYNMVGGIYNLLYNLNLMIKLLVGIALMCTAGLIRPSHYTKLVLIIGVTAGCCLFIMVNFMSLLPEVKNWIISYIH
jgi:hypothetical protein